jgi:spermidine/putrescine transport system permease protein
MVLPLRALLAAPVALVLVVGCIAPLLILVAFSFFDVDLDTYSLVPAFQSRAWMELVSKPLYAQLIGKAVVHGVGTACLAAIAAYPIALALVRVPPAWRGVAGVVLLTPLYTGEIVRIYAWRVVLGAEGLVNAVLQGLHLIEKPLQFLLFSPFTTHLVLLYNNLPFMVLALWISVSLVDERLIEAARDLGAYPWQAFFRITLPLTLPGLSVGLFAVFALAAGDMMTPSLLGGTSGATAMGMIDTLFGTAFDWPLASALALALLVTLFGLTVVGFSLLFASRTARSVIRGIGT